MKKKMGFQTAVSLVIANMVGTGVFTSLGFQVVDLHSVFTLVMLWLIGGVIALCGALTYGEIGSAFPRSGGEYEYLSRLYHPILGFMSGWVSATIGFAAPVALAAMAMGTYTQRVFPSVNPTMLALSVVLFITLIHAFNVHTGSKFQRVFTFIKLVVIIVFILFGFIDLPTHDISLLPSESAFKEIFSPAFAVSLIFVSYAYSGWNAATYISGEIENAPTNVPKALFAGTLIVTGIYVILNYVFLRSVPMNELAGKVEIGFISAFHIFGPHFGNTMGVVISLLLVSSISAMIMAGPRVVSCMGEDLRMLSFLAIRNKNGAPYLSIFLQSAISVGLIVTAKFETVLTFVGFSLNLFTFLTVFGVFILRYRNEKTGSVYKTWGYPITPIIFLALNAWILYFVFIDKPMESLFGIVNVLIGGGIWMAGKYILKGNFTIEKK